MAAAGNDQTDNDLMPFYPASYNLPNIIAVLATDHNDQSASFSHWGKTSVDLGAPGVNIHSTVPIDLDNDGNPNGYQSMTEHRWPVRMWQGLAHWFGLRRRR